MPICRSCCFRHKLSKMANPQTFPVKVKGILKGTTETEVYDSFRDAGCPFENCRVVDTDGYAHVNFSTLVEANKARDLLNANQIELKGQTLYCTGGEDKFNPGSFGSSAQPQTRRSRFKGPSTQASDDSPRAIVLTGMQSISEAKLLTDLQKLDGRVLSVKKTPNGTCFVNIHPSLSPREVIETLKGKAIEGVPLHATPYFDKSSNCAVYVSHIPPDIQTDQDLSAMLSKYGQVVAALLTRESDGRAHGTVQFSSPIEMEKAVEAFQGDETMKVTRFKSKKMRSADAMKDGEMKLQEWAQRTVHVQGVPIGTTQAEIVELFTPYQLDVCKVFPPRDGHSTTSAKVTLKSAQAAETAIVEMSGQLINGGRLKVSKHKSKTMGEPGAGDSKTNGMGMTGAGYGMPQNAMLQMMTMMKLMQTMSMQQWQQQQQQQQKQQLQWMQQKQQQLQQQKQQQLQQHLQQQQQQGQPIQQPSSMRTQYTPAPYLQQQSHQHTHVVDYQHQQHQQPHHQQIHTMEYQQQQMAGSGYGVSQHAMSHVPSSTSPATEWSHGSSSYAAIPGVAQGSTVRTPLSTPSFPTYQQSTPDRQFARSSEPAPTQPSTSGSTGRRQRLGRGGSRQTSDSPKHISNSQATSATQTAAGISAVPVSKQTPKQPTQVEVVNAAATATMDRKQVARQLLKKLQNIQDKQKIGMTTQLMHKFVKRIFPNQGVCADLLQDDSKLLIFAQTFVYNNASASSV
eukprot:m.43635 g.43635  ORF g.43635 m.43635 type:complete len:736 (-) comp10787_c0_seq1:1821-4028(-)